MRKLKEGYIGQTVEDFLGCMAGVPTKFYLSNIEDDDYNPIELDDLDEVIERFGDCEFREFDCCGQALVVNVSNEIESYDDYYSDIESFLDDANEEDFVIYDFDTEETVFEGDRWEFEEDESLQDYMFMSFDAPDCISITYEEDSSFDDFDDEDDEEDYGEYDESLKESTQSTLDLLIKDEEEAIDGYKKAIKSSKDEKEIEVFKHILEEEQEHIEELKKLMNNVNESASKGKVATYKGFGITDVGKKYVVTNQNGKTVFSSKNPVSIIKELIDDFINKGVKPVTEELTTTVDDYKKLIQNAKTIEELKDLKQKILANSNEMTDKQVQALKNLYKYRLKNINDNVDEIDD